MPLNLHDYTGEYIIATIYMGRDYAQKRITKILIINL